jgi:hypothetical protein
MCNCKNKPNSNPRPQVSRPHRPNPQIAQPPRPVTPQPVPQQNGYQGQK